MRSMKKALRMLLSFVLMIGVVLSIFSLFIRFVLLNGDYIGDKLEDRGYYTKLAEDLNTKYATLSLESSIPEEVFMSAVLDDYEVQKLTRKNVNVMVDYMTYKTEDSTIVLDQDLFSEPVTTYVENYTKENNVPMDDDLKARTNQIVDSATEITENRVTLFNLRNVVNIPQFQTVRKLLNVAYNSVIPVFIGVAVIIVLLALLYRNKRYRVLFWIGSSISAASVFVIVPSVLALIMKIPHRIQISSSHVNTAVQNLVHGYTTYFLTTGLIALALGLLSFFLYFYIRSKSTHPNSQNLE